jgi:cytochrome c oxidase assembly protein subunit 15
MTGQKMQYRRTHYRLVLFTLLLAFCVILMGAYVRLSDAGLGCPDWPGCYGRMVAPSHQDAVGEGFAGRPLQSDKAWKEMIHRYLAGALGLAILALAIIAWRNRQHGQPLLLPALLLLLVMLQAALGMWTVTLLVKPAVVTAHLLGGFATLALLWLLLLQLRGAPAAVAAGLARHDRALMILALVTVIVQITLGGWTSSNYAALSCSEFPTCYAGQWWPPTDFREAFVIWRGVGINYEYGVLESDARTAIHLAHRLGALAALIITGLLGLRLAGRYSGALRSAGFLLLAVLLLQVVLGIANVVGRLSLPVAVAHNGTAAILLLTLITLLWISRRHE